MRILGSLFAALALLVHGVLAAPPSEAAQQWEVLNGLDDDVRDIVFGPDGTLYAGGYFTGYVASWDGTSWTALGGLDGSVVALAIDSAGTLFAAGNFTGKVAEWNGSGWDTSLGVFPTDLEPDALVLRGGILFAAGSAPNDPYMASWDGTSWSPLTAGSGPTDSIGALVSGPNGIVAGSDDGNVYEFSSGSWSQIGGALGILVPDRWGPRHRQHLLPDLRVRWNVVRGRSGKRDGVGVRRSISNVVTGCTGSLGN